jgi:hypothetical protein
MFASRRWYRQELFEKKQCETKMLPLEATTCTREVITASVMENTKDSLLIQEEQEDLVWLQVFTKRYLGKS